eukprot:Clim_evm1s228 gene=Clim_evmTU1s228
MSPNDFNNGFYNKNSGNVGGSNLSNKANTNNTFGINPSPQHISMDPANTWGVSNQGTAAPGTEGSFAKTLQEIEERSEEISKALRKVLPHIGRILVTSTFLDDGLRMIFQWNEQMKYLTKQFWGFSTLAAIFIVINMIVQLGATGMIVARYQLTIAAIALAGIVVIQTLTYTALWDAGFFLKSMSVLGGLVLIVAQDNQNIQQKFTGALTTDADKKPVNNLLLAGRLMIVLLVLCSYEMFLPVYIVSLALALCIVAGFQTKSASLVLMVILFLYDIVVNQFWTVRSTTYRYDLLKYDFFQLLSVVGALALLTAMGAGDISVDKRKKDF